jgi:hypothetical protein
MRRVAFFVLTLALAPQAPGQVDVEHRRVVTLQTGFALRDEEEANAFGYVWYNQNAYPWTNTALRVIFAGIFADGELSYFLPANTNIAVGAGLGGGFYIDSITPYHDGELVSKQRFYGDVANGRVFVNETIPNPTPLPLNVRATYGLTGSFYRRTDTTRHFTIPDDFLTQSLTAELRFGGIEPGLTARRGAEVYLAADANYRTGFEAFGPNGALLPAHTEYRRVYGSLAAKIPARQTTFYARVGGGLGEDLDELSAYKLGGNLLGVEPFTWTLHGYYTREFFADDFGIANLEVRQQLTETHALTVHLYGDWAVVKPVPPETPDWDNLFGVGTGLSFRALGNMDWLISYGYGVNAVRNGDHGGHEIGLALEKKF